MGWGGVGAAKNGLYTIHCKRDRIVVSSKAQKQPQCTCQARTVIGSSLTLHAGLLSALQWYYIPCSGCVWIVLE